jgi:hypothetical protein
MQGEERKAERKRKDETARKKLEKKVRKPLLDLARCFGLPKVPR